MSSDEIRIGTLAGKGPHTADYIRSILPHGFESFQIQFGETLGDTDLSELARELADILPESGAIISCLGIYGNPLGTMPLDEETREGWRRLIKHARDFGTDLVTGFTGRVSGESIPHSMRRYKEVFSDLNKLAKDSGVRIAFENCPKRGTWDHGEWNLAHNPPAWERLFDELPSDNIGLEWEPCHQMCQLIDPIPQIDIWGEKFFHIHGKDANIRKDLLQRYGIHGERPFFEHRHPGLGDCDWAHIISELRRVQYRGTIDIEGWHDRVYSGYLEMSGQVHALNYLKSCRPAYVQNPEENWA